MKHIDTLESLADHYASTLTQIVLFKTHHAVFYASLTLMWCLQRQTLRRISAISDWSKRLPWSYLQNNKTILWCMSLWHSKHFTQL